MKYAVLFVLLSAFALAGCGAFTVSTPAPLPTVVLENNAASQGSSTGSGREVSASGFIVPAQEAQVSFSLGQSVKTVNVAAGDQVTAGQVLIILAGSEKLAAVLESVKLELLSAQQALKTLNDKSSQARTAAQLRVANAQKALDDAQKRRAGKQYRNGSQSAIETAQADLILATNALETAQDAFTALADRSPEDVDRAAALSAMGTARKARDRALANLNYLLAMPNAIDVNRAEAELQAAKTELDEAQKEYDRLKDGPDPDALALANARIQNARAQIEATLADIASLELKAPFAGTVSKVNIHSGEWAVAGQPVLVLADLRKLHVETKDLSERDIPAVEVGQPATIQIKALNQEVQGHVSAISPLADTIGGDVVYQTTIELDTQPEGLRAGMSVTVIIGSNP